MINFKLHFERKQQAQYGGAPIGMGTTVWEDDVLDLYDKIEKNDESIRHLPRDRYGNITQKTMAEYLWDLYKDPYKELYVKDKYPNVERPQLKQRRVGAILLKYGERSREFAARSGSTTQIGDPRKIEFIEGWATVDDRTSLGRYRDPEVRKEALRLNLEENGQYTCIMCKLKPENLYTLRNKQQAARFLYAHHLKPIEQGHRETNVKEDIIIVCGNCHVIADADARKKYDPSGKTLPSADDSDLQVPAVQ